MSSKNSVRPSDRLSALRTQKTLKMARSAHAYVRGSTVKFYEWLEAQKRGTLPEGPPIWICGDCHAGNLGPVAALDGRTSIQIRDLDQTVIGNPAHDIIRLALSLAMASRGSDLPGITTAHIIEQMIDGYEQAFAPEAEGQTHDSAADMPKIIKVLMREAAGRSWKHLADERIEGIEPIIPLGKRFWPLTKEENEAIVSLFEQEDARKLVTAVRSLDHAAQVRVLDAAYWRKGCSSLGSLRFAVLIAVDVGKQ